MRCDGLQQYSRKLSTKKSQDFLLIVSALRIIFFLIWLTNVIVYFIQYILPRPMKWAIRKEFTTTDWTNKDYRMT
jgi:hypothetical protein